MRTNPRPNPHAGPCRHDPDASFVGVERLEARMILAAGSEVVVPIDSAGFGDESGFIESGGDTDTFEFTPNGSGWATIYLSASNPDLALAIFDDDGGMSHGSREVTVSEGRGIVGMTAFVLEGECYQVRVRSVNGSGGSYDLDFNTPFDVGRKVPAGNVTLSSSSGDGSTSGVVGDPLDFRGAPHEVVYTFTPRASGNVSIEVAPDGGLDPIIVLHEDSGNWINYRDLNGTGEAESVERELTGGVTYRLLISAYKNTSGSFNVYVEGEPLGDTSPPSDGGYGYNSGGGDYDYNSGGGGYDYNSGGGVLTNSGADGFLGFYASEMNGGLPAGDDIPDMLRSVAPDAAYSVADWGAENYWFQTSNGDVWSLWHGGAVHELPSGEHEWVLTNLADEAGLLGQLDIDVGTISGVFTGWRAFSIQGVQNGEVLSLWWSPEAQDRGFGNRGNGWSLTSISDSLTSPTNGTPIQPPRFASFSQTFGDGRTTFNPSASHQEQHSGMSIVLVSTSGDVYVATFTVWNASIQGADDALNHQWLLERFQDVPSVASGLTPGVQAAYMDQFRFQAGV